MFRKKEHEAWVKSAIALFIRRKGVRWYYSADEIAQDAYIGYWNSIDDLDEDRQTCRAYVMKCCEHFMLDGLRRNVRSKKKRNFLFADSLDDELSDEVPFLDSDPEFIDVDTLESYLVPCNRLEKDMLRDYYLRGLIYQELATNYGMAISTVQNKMDKAKKRIREYLKNKD